VVTVREIDTGFPHGPRLEDPAFVKRRTRAGYISWYKQQMICSRPETRIGSASRYVFRTSGNGKNLPHHFCPFLSLQLLLPVVVITIRPFFTFTHILWTVLAVITFKISAGHHPVLCFPAPSWIYLQHGIRRIIFNILGLISTASRVSLLIFFQPTNFATRPFRKTLRECAHRSFRRVGVLCIPLIGARSCCCRDPP
jgi:hypothetical protein